MMKAIELELKLRWQELKEPHPETKRAYRPRNASAFHQLTIHQFIID